MATVYGIVKQSAGHIEVLSEPNQGATFKIYLPREREGLFFAKPQNAYPDTPEGCETVLLAEDEDAVRTLARLSLQREGYTVLEARHGEEALEIAERFKGAIHLLLTDLVMPKLSGRQLAELLLKSRPALKVLYVSGYMDDAIIRHGLLMASTAFLQKPFSPDAKAQAQKYENCWINDNLSANDLMKAIAFNPLRHLSIARVPVVASVLAILVGTLVLIGWRLNEPHLIRVMPHFPAMAPTDALAYVFAGIGLFLLRKPGALQAVQRLARVCASVAALLGLLVVLEYSLNWSLGFDSLFVPSFTIGDSPQAPWLASFHSGPTLILIGLAIALLDVDPQRGPPPAQLLAIVAGNLVLLVLFGYILGNSELYIANKSRDAGMALHSALLGPPLADSGNSLCPPSYRFLGTPSRHGRRGRAGAALAPPPTGSAVAFCNRQCDRQEHRLTEQRIQHLVVRGGIPDFLLVHLLVGGQNGAGG